jgi:hypothetical protein
VARGWAPARGASVRAASPPAGTDARPGGARRFVAARRRPREKNRVGKAGGCGVAPRAGGRAVRRGKREKKARFKRA